MSRLRRYAPRVALALAVLIVLGVLWARSALQDLGVVPITDDAWMITGLGGNVGVLRTSEGTVVVDSMTFPLQGKAIRERAEELTGAPVAVVVNTHYHLDHSHGNPGFEGVRVVSTERTKHHMTTREASFWDKHPGALPGETFTADRDLRIGDKTVRLLHPGRGHTDGDLVALFVEDRVLVAGDLFFHRHYPNIDLEAGGSVTLWGQSLERVFPMGFDHVVPGHGALATPADLRGFQTFIEQLAAVGRKAAAVGWTLDETLQKADLTADAGYTNVLPMLTREFVLTRAWEEATGAVTPDRR